MNKKNRLKRYNQVSAIIAIGITALVIATPLFLIAVQQQQNLKQQAASNNTGLDAIVKQALGSLMNYGFNPSVNGMWINWYIDNPTGHQNTGYDKQNDFNMYTQLIWYEYRHPGDTSFQTEISKISPAIEATWKTSTSEKGWIYFEMLRIEKFTGDKTWDTTMKNWAAAVYKTIDPAVGVQHGSIVDNTGSNAPTYPDAYRVDQNLENGLALIDAGNRFNNTTWVQAGKKEVDVITQQGFVTKYNLYARIVCNNGGTWTPCNWEAKAGEYGQEADSFIQTGNYLKSIGQDGSSYLTKAQTILNSVADPNTGLEDTQHGGLYFKKLLDTGTVDTSRKEIRQFHTLMAVHELNKAGLGNANTSALEQGLIQAAQASYKTNTAMNPLVSGWMYEENNDWTLYKGTENWISTEVSAIALEGIQTVLEDNQTTNPTPTTPGGTITPTPIGSTPTPPFATPSYVCGGTTNSICPTSTPAPTSTLPTEPVQPSGTQLTPTSGATLSIVPSVSSTLPSITNTPPTTGKSNNFLIAILLLILEFFVRLLSHLHH